MEGQARSMNETEQARATHKLSNTEGDTNKDTKETEQARGTHILLSVEGEKSEDIKRNQESIGHSQTAKHRGRDKSGH